MLSPQKKPTFTLLSYIPIYSHIVAHETITIKQPCFAFQNTSLSTSLKHSPTDERTHLKQSHCFRQKPHCQTHAHLTRAVACSHSSSQQSTNLSPGTYIHVYSLTLKCPNKPHAPHTHKRLEWHTHTSVRAPSLSNAWNDTRTHKNYHARTHARTHTESNTRTTTAD